MSNKDRHQELLTKISTLSTKLDSMTGIIDKRLDTLDDKLDQLLIATAKISAEHPELPPKPLAYQTQSQIKGPAVPVEKMRDAARHAWGFPPVPDPSTKPPAAE